MRRAGITVALLFLAAAGIIWLLLGEDARKGKTREPRAEVSREETLKEKESTEKSERVPFPSNLKEIVEKDDVCALQKIWGNAPDDELNRVFLQSTELRPEDDPIDQMLSSLARKDLSIASAPESFGKQGPALIRALAWAGLLDGMPGPLKIRKARKILMTLSREDPSNAAFPFFLAAVEEKMGRTTDSLQAIEQAVLRKKFDTFYEDLSRKIREHSLESATLFLLGVQFYSRIPFPNLYAGSQIVHRRIQEDDLVFARSALDFGQMLMNQYLTQREYCCELEYTMGRSIYLDAWKKLNPGREIPKTAELSEARRRVGAWARYPELELLAADPDATCKRDVVDRVVHDERLRLRRE